MKLVASGIAVPLPEIDQTSQARKRVDHLIRYLASQQIQIKNPVAFFEFEKARGTSCRRVI